MAMQLVIAVEDLTWGELRRFVSMSDKPDDAKVDLDYHEDGDGGLWPTKLTLDVTVPPIWTRGD